VTGEDASVKAVVELRCQNKNVGENMALELVASKIDGRGTGTDDQRVPWAADAWLAQEVWHPEAWCSLESRPTDDRADGSGVWSSAAHHALTRLASSLQPADQPGTTISRDDVFKRREGDPLELFLAVMAWGYGDRGYGWRRTADILAAAQRSGGASRLAEAVQRLRDAGAGDREALFHAWSRGGAAKLYGLGPAFASKVAYFVSYDRQNGSGPLIVDNNTGWSIWALAGIAHSPSSAASYARYVELAERWSGHLRCRSDDVERALFELGPKMRDAYRSR
jgi:hypothetical protein